MQLLSAVGATLIVTAFAFLQRGRWRQDQQSYLWCNLIGSTALAAVAIWDRRVGFIALETVWALVSIWSLIRARANNVDTTESRS